jgi:4a-hydroxytetrahydrobiopterin dehydratase
MARYQLSDDQLSQAIADLDSWSLENGKLYKEFRFASFAAAIGWMVSVAIHADRLDHHPEWTNVYNRVKVNLVTHDLGNVVSNLDLELASTMDRLTKGSR